ncbi:MAG TPA: alpha/beta fold hydrolase [Solirubrobacteraceae bacterium]
MALVARIAVSALTRPPRHSLGDDRSQVADLHVPRGPGPFPVVVLLHGGYWRTKYGRLITRPLARDLVDRGFAAWNLEYRRVGTGRGGGGGWPMTFDDVANGIDALATLQDPRLDLDRVAVVGHSAGGQLALWSAARRNAKVEPQRVVALAPVTDLLRTGERAHALLGGTPDQVPERFAAADPLQNVPLPVPVLIVHPQDDETIPVRRSRAYAEKSGANVTLVEPPAGGHRSPTDPATDAWRTAAEWLQAS